MNSAAKLIIGIIILLIGLYWYAAPLFGHNGLQNIIGHSTFDSFKVVFAGLFGLLLIFLGAIVAWIEYEDIKWERKEKKEKPAEDEEKPAKKKK
ncbi:hypothetical protein J4447_02200 [Candidatus Pacearchaeota archaeon]|nr:hypothetical protein [Candidatus Pacearchaeota archaeon]